MAIAFSQTSSAVSSWSNSTSHTFNGNGLNAVSPISNGIAFVLYDCAGLGVDPLTVSWGWSAMTKIGSINQTTRGNTQSLWYILNPASWAISVTDTFSANNAPNIIFSTYSGVKQSAPEASNTGSITGANSLGVSVTTITPNAWVVSWFTNNLWNGVAWVNTTSRFSGVLSLWDTNSAVATPSLQAQNWSLTWSTNWTGFSVSIAPFVATWSSNGMLQFFL